MNMRKFSKIFDLNRMDTDKNDPYILVFSIISSKENVWE